MEPVQGKLSDGRQGVGACPIPVEEELRLPEAVAPFAWVFSPLPSHLVRHKKLSLCMIVRNEERFLSQALDSVKDLVDEMVVVDTGSEDNTVAIAQSYGARVSSHEWKNDFAKARNRAISEATGDWILMLDGDEVLDRRCFSRIRELIQKDVQVGYSFKFVNIMNDNEDPDIVRHYYIRLFPRSEDIYYKGALHEQVTQRIPDPDGTFIEFPVDRIVTDVVIYHQGYKPDLYRGRNKSERNIGILMESLEREPDHPFHHFNLGVSYFLDSEHEKALFEFERAETLCHPRHSYLPMVLIYGALCHQILGHMDRGLEKARKAVLVLPTSSEAHCILASLLETRGDDAGAEQEYLKALECGKHDNVYIFSDRSTSGWRTCNQLGMLYTRMGRMDEAISYFERAATEKPASVMLLVNTARAFRRAGRNAEAHFWLSRAYDIEPSGLERELADLLLTTNRRDEALEILESYASGNPSDLQVRLALAYQYQVSGDNEKAISRYRWYLEDGSRRPDVFQNAGFCAYQMGDLVSAESFWREGVKCGGGTDLLCNLGVLALNQGDREKALSRFREAASLDPECKKALSALGTILFDLRRHEEALPFLSRVVEKEDADPEVLLKWKLAQGYVEAGKLQNAK
ncbi:MAG: tetratricopeptide repeat protein [Armatimonadetes bacterium]|nr:tetratricopeptide repeat protein [Armatimonadota bacterium]